MLVVEHEAGAANSEDDSHFYITLIARSMVDGTTTLRT